MTQTAKVMTFMQPGLAKIMGLSFEFLEFDESRIITTNVLVSTYKKVSNGRKIILIEDQREKSGNYQRHF